MISYHVFMTPHTQLTYAVRCCTLIGLYKVKLKINHQHENYFDYDMSERRISAVALSGFTHCNPICTHKCAEYI